MNCMHKVFFVQVAKQKKHFHMICYSTIINHTIAHVIVCTLLPQSVAQKSARWVRNDVTRGNSFANVTGQGLCAMLNIETKRGFPAASKQRRPCWFDLVRTDLFLCIWPQFCNPYSYFKTDEFLCFLSGGISSSFMPYLAVHCTHGWLAHTQIP